MKKITVLSVFALVVLLISFGYVQRNVPQSDKTPYSFLLRPPSFVSSASAGSSGIGSLLDSEAGISAYIYSASPITLNSVRGSYRTIEAETANYIIGSVAISGYTEQYDVHVYVHTDGWILGYYLANDPTGKIIHVKAETLSTTHLKTAISVIAGAVGIPVTNVIYYDFRYPNATNLLLIGENDDNGSAFTISMPSSYGYYERSWANVGSWCSIKVDGSDKAPTYSGDSAGTTSCYGKLSPSELLPDITHTISMARRYSGLVITYRVP